MALFVGERPGERVRAQRLGGERLFVCGRLFAGERILGGERRAES